MVELFHGKPMPVRSVPRHLLGPIPTGTLPSHQIRGIVVMDSGCDYRGEPALTHLTNLLDTVRSGGNNAEDLPCHFYIDPGGVVYTGAPVYVPGSVHDGGPYTIRASEAEPGEAARARLARKRNPELDLNGYILICFLGDYDSEMMDEAREKSLFQLCAFLVYQHNIALERIYGLADLHPGTKNPGFYLKNYLRQSILEANIPPPPAKHRFLIPEPRADGR